MIIKSIYIVAIVIAFSISGCGNNEERISPSTPSSPSSPVADADISASKNNTSNVSTTSTITLSGRAVDGYISGATACLDKDINGICDSSEPVVETDTNGTITFTDVTVNKSNSLISVIVTGGTDMATGKPFQGSASAIIKIVDANKTFIASPLTSLVSNAFIASKDNSLATLTHIKKKIASSLDINVTKLDANPMRDKKVFAIVQMIQQTKQLILTSAMKNSSGSLTKKELEKSIQDSITTSIENGFDINTTKIIENLEKQQVNITIPLDEQEFISKQTTQMKNFLDEVVTNPYLTTDDLGQQQKNIEIVIENTLKKKKLLIPLYSYPHKGNWERLINLKKKYPSVDIVAIVNQSNGDFTKKSEDYVKGIQSLSDAGIQVVGYVYTKEGSRSILDVKANIDAWVKFYKPYGLKGFFFDEVASKNYEDSNNKSYFSYYKEISKYARSKGCKIIVLNPGAVVNDEYMKSGIASVIIIRETTYNRVNKDRELFNTPTAATKLGLLIYSSSEKHIVSDVCNFARKYQFDYIYATDHGRDDDRWDQLSSYLDSFTATINLFKTFHVGFDGDYSFNSREEGKKIWMNSVDLAMDDNISNNSSYQNIKKFNPSAFNNLHNSLKKSKFLVYWITKGWEENWYDRDKIQKAMDVGYVPVFNYWWFGDKLMNGVPDEATKDAYTQDNLKVAKFLNKLHGSKLLIMEPEFNKNNILADATTQHQFAAIIGNAIDTIRDNSKNVLFSLAMTDTGNRDVNKTYEKCSYENCGLGDKYEWGRPSIIYNDLLPNLDFISFQEMVGQFSRNPADPGGWDSPNPIAYSDANTGINELAQRIANFTQFLHDKYHKPLFLPYIGIATATWKDTNNNGTIEDSEINKSGWEKEAKGFYTELLSMKQLLLANGLFGFAPMALFDEPQHDYPGYQFFMNNEYHLGILKSSARDQVDIATNGDIQSKSGIVGIIFSDQNKSK